MRTAMTMTIDTDGNISLEAVTDSSELRFEDVSLSTSVITVGQPFTISYSGVSHNFDEEETLTPVLINSQSAIIAYAESHTIRGYSGEMSEGKWQVVFNGDIKPGGYSVTVITEKMMSVCTPIPVAVIDDRTEVSWEVTNVRINRQLASAEMNVIAGDEMSASCRAELATGSDSEAVYLNLFGRRVDNPAAGQIVIRRQGASVSKVIL